MVIGKRKQIVELTRDQWLEGMQRHMRRFEGELVINNCPFCVIVNVACHKCSVERVCYEYIRMHGKQAQLFALEFYYDYGKERGWDSTDISECTVKQTKGCLECEDNATCPDSTK